VRNIDCTYICSVIIQVILLNIKTQNIARIKKRGKKERKDLLLLILSLFKKYQRKKIAIKSYMTS